MEGDLAIVWLRRDLRLEDNTALHAAVSQGFKVLPLFIFDDNILNELPKNDGRVNFIYELLSGINEELKVTNSSIEVRRGKPLDIWSQLVQEQDIKAVFFNKDYEPYALERDKQVEDFLTARHIKVHTFNDHLLLEPGTVLKDDGEPYTVFTPFKRKFLQVLGEVRPYPKPNPNVFVNSNSSFPLKSDLGIEDSTIKVKPYNLDALSQYGETRDFPAKDNGSYLGPHLRFGSISPRSLYLRVKTISDVFVSEIIWREFFSHILHFYPNVVHNNFKSKYDGIQWRNNEAEFEKWCKGETGYPIVDAGMRELNETGYMHNRVRMITASFLCKHLLIDWRWGEAYFAQKLLDFDLSSNNGNWQWVAGTGCDSAPYFRVFNPYEQVKKFDPQFEYIRMWVRDFDDLTYPQAMVEHKFARERALETYKTGLARYAD